MPSITYSHIPVIDVECTCYEHGFPPGQVQEIIEIGIAHLNVKTLKVEKVESLLIPPTASVISTFCSQLTTLTPEMFDWDKEQEHELWSFQDACDILRNGYLTRIRPWASWGDFDRTMFETQCLRDDVQHPFGKAHLNVKALFSMFTGSTHGYGMKKALKMAKLKMEGTHHRGHDDARNIARLLAWIFQHRDA